MKPEESNRARFKKAHKVLKEDQGGGDVGSSHAGYGGFSSYDAMYGGMYGYGGGMGGPSVSVKDLYKSFVEPFTDFFKTLIGQTKEIGRRVFTLLEIALEAVLSTLIPYVTAEYASIFDRESRDIQRIRDEYKDVYARTSEAFGNNDVAILAFMAYPVEFLAGSVAVKTPSFIRGMLGAVTGGFSEKLLKNVLESQDKSSMVLSFIRLTEDEKKSIKKDKPSLSDVVGSKKFITYSITNSLSATSVSRSARQAYLKTLVEIQNKAKKMLSIRSIDDIEKMSGNSEEIDSIRSMPDKERLPAEEAFVKAVKASIKKVYIDGLQFRINKALQGGVSESSKFIHDHRTVIDNIMKL